MEYYAGIMSKNTLLIYVPTWVNLKKVKNAGDTRRRLALALGWEHGLIACRNKGIWGLIQVFA